MPCDVCIGGYKFDDLAKNITVQTPVAERSYRCLECGGAIPLGEKYFQCSYTYDKVFHTDITCALCAEIIGVFSCDGGAHPVGQLWEEMEEYAFPSLTFSSECFRELSPGAKTYVLQRWQKWKGLATTTTSQ